MLRTAATLRAAAAAAPLVQAAAPRPAFLRTWLQLKRLVGSTNKHVAATEGFTAVIRAPAATGRAVSVALVGRAMVLMNRGNEAAALADLEAAAATDAAGRAVTGPLIAGLQARCAARLLAAERRSATVAGTATAARVAALDALLAASLGALAGASKDWAVALAAAEYALAAGRHAAALEGFEAVLAAVAAEAAAGKSPRAAKAAAAAATAAVSPVTALALRFESSLKSVAATRSAVLRHPSLAAAAAAAVAPVATDAEAAAVRDAAGDPGLALGAVPLLSSVLARAEAGATFIEMVGAPSAAFGPWTSAGAQRVQFAITMDEHPIVDAAVGAPPAAFHRPRLAEALAGCPPSAHVLDHLDAVCGAVPRTALAAADASFFAAVAQLDANFDRHLKDTALINDLLTQIAHRAAVGRAEALDGLARHEEAIAALDAVVRADDYIDMWRALMCQGRALAAVGRVDDSDAAFRKLHSLKRQPGVDIPLLDEYRYKSAF